MQNFNCVNGSGWVDVCVNTYGSLDYFIKMINDNGLSPEVAPFSNQLVVWDNSLVQNQSIRNTISAKNIIFATYPFNTNYLLTEDNEAILTEDGLPIEI